MNRYMSLPRKTFLWFNSIVLVILALICLLPILHVFAQSLSSSGAIQRGEVLLLPVETTLENYRYILQDAALWRSFSVTVFLATAGTAFNLIMTASLAYPLSRPEYMGRRIFLFLIMFTMIFGAPLIPSYILIQSLGLLDSILALIIPTAISAFNFFIMRSFFMNIPSELIDSSRIDGCGELGILTRIVLPLSKPALATLGIFYAVFHWNTYFNALMYIRDRSLYPLQIKLRQVLIDEQSLNDITGDYLLYVSPDGIKMATVMIATIPIILVYPFVQKHFVKGALLGSVKE